MKKLFIIASILILSVGCAREREEVKLTNEQEQDGSVYIEVKHFGEQACFTAAGEMGIICHNVKSEKCKKLTGCIVATNGLSANPTQSELLNAATLFADNWVIDGTLLIEDNPEFSYWLYQKLYGTYFLNEPWID